MTLVQERYAKAAHTTDLTVKETRCDADLLLASGMVGQGRAGSLAIYLQRLQSGDVSEHGNVIREAVDLLKSGRHRAKFKPVWKQSELKAIAHGVAHWWVDPICNHCHGRKFVLSDISKQMLSTEFCHHCHGTGKKALAPFVRQHIEAGEWLAAEFERAVGFMNGQMASKLFEVAL